jgi:hypothetical protein
MSLHPDKKPFRVIRRFNEQGVKHVELEADFWEGPDGSGNETGYRTRRWVENAKTHRPSTCSFAGELAKALK